MGDPAVRFVLLLSDAGYLSCTSGTKNYIPLRPLIMESATDAEIDEIDRLIAEKEAEKEKLASSLEQMKLITKSLEMMHGRDEETVAETLRASRRLLASHRARMAGPQIQVGGYARSDFDSNLHDEAFDMPICID
eukprot:CAMPEP_0116835944 /NCGR_PEP_ID=MMETSP0418-20121206/7820_1 /TAXON_ID=1158023 /ORGANISM="Astrosyne radiata, Strain 13vi08-1A" /LENGTH=134 /DNA_ID=CAMNT_0004465655 /DNA_START=204 /DNA_END=609 /DNA_ORIENTATION=+